MTGLDVDVAWVSAAEVVECGGVFRGQVAVTNRGTASVVVGDDVVVRWDRADGSAVDQVKGSWQDRALSWLTVPAGGRVALSVSDAAVERELMDMPRSMDPGRYVVHAGVLLRGVGPRWLAPREVRVRPLVLPQEWDGDERVKHGEVWPRLVRPVVTAFSTVRPEKLCPEAPEARPAVIDLVVTFAGEGTLRVGGLRGTHECLHSVRVEEAARTVTVHVMTAVDPQWKDEMARGGFSFFWGENVRWSMDLPLQAPVGDRLVACAARLPGDEGAELGS